MPANVAMATLIHGLCVERRIGKGREGVSWRVLQVLTSVSTAWACRMNHPPLRPMETFAVGPMRQTSLTSALVPGMYFDVIIDAVRTHAAQPLLAWCWTAIGDWTDYV